VVGEVRGPDAHALLKAWNTGHPGGAATVHANDAVSGLIRLESLVAEATRAPQPALIAEAVDLVIFVDEEPGIKAGRKVREVLLVPRPLRNVLSITHGGASILAAELPVDFGARLVDDSVPGTSFGS
jgi:Flp pilus assembly CpaF family ATPase